MVHNDVSASKEVDPMVVQDSDEVLVLRDRIESLEATIAALTEPAAGSRRNLLKLAGAAIVAGGVMATADTTRVSAATTDLMEVGVRHFATNITRIEYGTGPKLAALPLTTETRMLWVDNSGSPNPSAVGIQGNGNATSGVGVEGVGNIGVRGTGSTTAGVGVGGIGYFGVASYGTVGVFITGTNAVLQLQTNVGGSPPNRVGVAGLAGQVAVDDASALWYCVASGTPGQWRKLSGVGTAGSFHAIDPARSYDSRWAGKTRITDGNSVLVSVADGHDPSGGVTAANVVPAGATAIAYNLTVTRTGGGGGFLSVTPGTPTAPTSPPTTSSINWSGDGANLANGLAVKLDASRQIRVRCGGGSTDFIIDVMGYYL